MPNTREAASERAAREKADVRAEKTQTQLDDCNKALVAERRRGFWGKVSATLKAAPLAFAAGAAVSAVVILAAVAAGGN